MQFGQTVAHEAVVAEVVALGAADGYGPAIGPLYSDHERSCATLTQCALATQLAPREERMGTIIGQVVGIHDQCQSRLPATPSVHA